MIKLVKLIEGRRHYRRHLIISALGGVTLVLMETHPVHAGLVNFATMLLWLWEE